MAVISFFGDQSQTYELYAVVDHVGDLRSGLYSVRIKIEEEHGDRWYNFDDARVTEVRLLVLSSLLLKHITKTAMLHSYVLQRRRKRSIICFFAFSITT